MLSNAEWHQMGKVVLGIFYYAEVIQELWKLKSHFPRKALPPENPDILVLQSLANELDWLNRSAHLGLLVDLQKSSSSVVLLYSVV